MTKFVYIDNIYKFEQKVWNTISNCNGINYKDFNGTIFLNKGNYKYLYTDEFSHEYYSQSSSQDFIPKQPTFDPPTSVGAGNPRIDRITDGNPWGKINNITFHKIYLDSTQSTTIGTTGSLIYDLSNIYKTPQTYAHSSNAQHITTNTNNKINLYAIVPNKVSSTIDKHYDITLHISLKGDNIENWANVTRTKIQERYKVEYTASGESYEYQPQDLYPHWEINDTAVTYYGGLAKLLKLSNKKICINIDSNVSLPFGFSNSIFQVDNTNTPLYTNLYAAIVGGGGDGAIIHNTQFSDPNVDNMVMVDLSFLSEQKLSEYIKNCTSSTPLENITINGGIINGSIIKASNCDWTNPKTNPNKYSSVNYPWEYLAMPWNAEPVRADMLSQNIDASSAVHWADGHIPIYQLLRSVEYWIFNGLLELYSNNIELNGVSVLCGMPRGIAPTQLNAYTHFDGASGTTTITNCQFCLNHYGQTDGLDILSNNVTYKNVYYQVADDTFKLASNNIKANNITIVSGAAGGAVNFGAYGTNVYSISAEVSNVFIHVYNKPSNKLDSPYTACPGELNKRPYCIDKRLTTECQYSFWPGPSIIFAPINPAATTANNQDITIKYMYVNNDYNINLNSDNTDYKPYMFLVGGFMSILNGYTQCGNPQYTNARFNWNIYYLYYNNIDQTGSLSLSNEMMGKGHSPLSYYINRVDNSNPTNQITINGIADHINDPDFSYNTIYNPYIKNQQWLGPDNNPQHGTNSTILYKNSCNGANQCYKCVDFVQPAKDGSNIQIWDCNEQPNQQWQYSTDQLTIKPNLDTNKCIDIPEGNMQNGTKLQLWDCNTTQQQQWITTGTDFQFQSAKTAGGKNFCIDLPSGNTTNGTQLQIWECQT